MPLLIWRTGLFSLMILHWNPSEIGVRALYDADRLVPLGYDQKYV
jgi:hypothetical protein